MCYGGLGLKASLNVLQAHILQAQFLFAAEHFVQQSTLQHVNHSS